MDNQKILRKMFIGTMIVMIVAELSGALTGIIDGIVTSIFLGNDKMSAVGVCNSYFSISAIISGILTIGTQALIVESISKGKKEDASKIASASIIIGFVVATIFSLLLWIFPRQIGVLFGASASDSVMLDNISEYFRGVAVGTPFLITFVILTPIIQLDGGGKFVNVGSITYALVDIVCDLIFTCVFKLDLFGMGLATGLSYVASCFVLGLFIFSKKSTIKLSIIKPNFKDLPRIISNGIPRAISMLSRTVGPIVLNIIVLNIAIGNNLGMGALSIQRSMSFTVSAIGWGIGGALLLLSSLYYNDRNYEEIKKTLKIAIMMILVVVGVFSITLTLLAPLIARVYVSNNDTQLLELTTIALRYYFISLPFLAFNVAFSNYMQSINKNFIANVINIMVECVALILFAFIFSRLYGFSGFFLGYLVGETILSLILVVIALINYFTNKNIYKKLFLDEDFVKEGTVVFERSVYSVDDAVKISESINELCKGTKLNEKQIFKLSLCVEEMTTNVFTHGFSKDNKKHNVMIRIVIEDERVCLTVIDDCKMFDITKKLQTCEVNKDNPEKNIGIRMIMLLAKEIHYSNTMNTNNLQIIL